MYLWNTTALVEDLRRGTLPESEQVKYLLFEVVSSALAISAPSGSAEPISTISVLDMVLSLLVAVGGTIWCFRTNASGDNKDFVSRYLALIVPIGIRFMAGVALLVLLLVPMIGSKWGAVLCGDEGTILSLAAASFFLAACAFWWRVSARIREVSHVG